MLSENEIKRYARQIHLPDIGMEGQEKLKQASVLVIGAGGLGCPVIQYLSAAGIGTIGIVDGDTVSESNLQRQILYTTQDIGKSKAAVASARAQQLNEYITINCIDEFITTQQALELFPNYDLVVDCSDNFGTRYLINDVCVLMGKPFVAAALFRYEGQLATYNVLQENGTYSANFRDVFPNNDLQSTTLNCNDAGVIATLPGIMGLYQANEVMNYFLNRNSCLCNKLFSFNCKNMSHFIFEVQPTNSARPKTLEEILSSSYGISCKNENHFQLNSFIEEDDAIIVDVREHGEMPEFNAIQHLQIPLSELKDNTHLLAPYNKILYVCKSGMRSKKAVEIMKAHYSNKIHYSHKSGVEELSSELENLSKPCNY